MDSLPSRDGTEKDIGRSRIRSGDVWTKADRQHSATHQTSGTVRKRLQTRRKQDTPKKDELSIPEETSLESKEALEEILNEVKYLRQEVEFLKKIVKTENTATRKS